MSAYTPEAETGGELREIQTLIEDRIVHTLDLRLDEDVPALAQDIQKYVAAHTRRAVLLGRVEELQHLPAQSRCPDCHTPHDSVSWRPTITDRIKTLEAELKEIAAHV